MDLDVFNITHNNVNPEAGKVLISVPFLDDSFFSKSVIYLVACDQKDTIGYILNKPMQMKLHELIEDIPNTDFDVYIGGPVDCERLNVLHTLGDKIPDSLSVGNGLYWGGDFESIRQMLLNGTLKKDEIRFFLGYSAWNPNQLNEEIEQNNWLVSDVSAKNIMSSQGEELWEQTLIKMGDKYKVWASFPSNPTLN